MLGQLIELIRRKNRERLERRRKSPPGWLSRFVRRIRAKNQERLGRRRAQREILASLAANDTAVLEAFVFLLRWAREEREARVAANAALMERLDALEKRLAGAPPIETRAETVPRPAPPAGGANGGTR